MVKSCVVFGCSARQHKGTDRSFFRIPSVIQNQGKEIEQLSKRRREKWLEKINRQSWTPSDSSRVCSAHFISGKPSPLLDSTNPDWSPSVNMGYHTCKRTDTERYHRAQKRRRQVAVHDASDSDQSSMEEGEDQAMIRSAGDSLVTIVATSTTTATHSAIGCQTEGYLEKLEEDIKDLRGDIERLRLDNLSLKEQLAKASGDANALTPENFKNDPTVLKFYTGLPNWIVFSALLVLVRPALASFHAKLTPFQMVLMFFMKIRLNLFDEDIALRFSVHRSTVSRNFYKVLEVMAVKTAHLIKWPDREVLCETQPSSFKRFFKKCCI